MNRAAAQSDYAEAPRATAELEDIVVPDKPVEAGPQPMLELLRLTGRAPKI
ncbi:hypothetical protein [Paenibacillus sp. FSL E2-0178]|uniref:hypothetical protein n=1 Tax=Paenibacillus sp. FSL E2-0178 TaxID=2921361 RepID=UPI0031583B87